jgi:iron complex outermembrane recepter protein
MVPPYTPKTKWSFGVQYDFENFWKGVLTARVDGSYQSKIFTDAINRPNEILDTFAAAKTPPGAFNSIDSYFLANGRLLYRDEETDWSLALEVRNIFNKYYFTGLFEQSQPTSSGTISGAPGMPRTWQVTLKKDF